MDPNKYFIRQYSQQQYMDGGIGYVDAEKILGQQGFKPISLPHHSGYSIGAKLGRFFSYLKLVRSIEKDSIVVFIFPVYARMNQLLLKALVKKGVKTVCYLADINGLKDGNTSLLRQEIHFFRRFSCFIVHNEKMKQWLEQTIPGSQSASIEFFDFLAKPSSVHHSLSYEIVFAGYLEKSPFLEKLDQLQEACPDIHFQLYGRGQTPAMLKQHKVTWNGIHRPHELPSKLTGSFGLVWDGESIDGPGGSLGDYMKYISHHKLSLYILAGLPLIVPSFAASAPLIEKYKIGITINSLYELEEKIKQISPGQYQQMQSNLKDLAKKVSEGECLKLALLMLNDKC